MNFSMKAITNKSQKERNQEINEGETLIKKTN